MFSRRCQQWQNKSVFSYPGPYTPQKHGMIFTVIFIDEATEATLDIDDWQTLTQGGYSAHNVKYQSAKSSINRCPMVITSQQRLNFGPFDQPAMDRRLTTYEFRSLLNPQRNAALWLKKHPMDCVIWATEKAKAFTDEENKSDEALVCRRWHFAGKRQGKATGTVPRPSMDGGSLQKVAGTHQSLGTFDTAEAIAERKKVCMALGLLREKDHHLVTSVAERLPVSSDLRMDESAQQHDGGNESEDEERLYITPVPPGKRLSADVVSTGVSDCAISESAETEKVQEYPRRERAGMERAFSSLKF
ncbi:hypothetical protein OS493_000649 [Desmophyllum pertusum]|uniref:Uncharacterized protein n=1 Tax=Desmophyllum pertusum TaxID=174260 RepID=A0A9X0DCE6_9CNID|nr:hypothetical protein OS493_000649 [Desmophyllum pertusum]